MSIKTNKNKVNNLLSELGSIGFNGFCTTEGKILYIHVRWLSCLGVVNEVPEICSV